MGVSEGETETLRLVRPFDEAIDVGHGVRLLLVSPAEYLIDPDGERWLPPHHVMLEHRCQAWPSEVDGHLVQKLVAPELDPAHAIHRAEYGGPLSITPSLLCPDCGLHGYVTDGRWVPA